MISPATAVTDTNTEIAKPRGKFVSVHAWAKLSKVRGLGSEKALLRFVVLPQGLRIALPALMGFAIIIFQATSLC